MIYTNQTRKAMRIAYRAHENQTDKSGVPYIFHVVHLAEQMTEESTVIAALLHDVVEDTTVTLEDLRRAGFSQEVLTAVELLTHDPAIPYLDYIWKLKDNPIAHVVKRADLRHNSDATRLPQCDEKVKQSIASYRRALEILEE